MTEMEDRLTRHLTTWLGTWPPPPGELVVATCRLRTEPGWDGEVRDFGGVGNGDGMVVSVAPGRLDAARAAAGGGLDAVAQSVGGSGARVFEGIFRWSANPTGADELPDAGVWIDHDDERVPDWLKPFGHQVLMALDDDGVYAAGVGIKHHDDVGKELAVVTEEAHRGKGLAARLVAQAARWVIAEGGVPTYLHAPSNTASARTAVRCGFPDEGWRIYGLAR